MKPEMVVKVVLFLERPSTDVADIKLHFPSYYLERLA
jgi:hypothetical protein